jgi:hypothetical protein
VSTNNETKLKRLLELHRPGTVLLATWLEKQGFSRSLQARYRRSGWLASVGTGAFKRPSEEVTWQGGLHALQDQAGLAIHAGALTAFSLQGFAHYLRLGQQVVFLFSARGVTLPAWFRKHDWGVAVRHVPTSVLPAELGLADHEEKTFNVRLSTPERAMLECLHLAPKELDLLECFQVMEGLANLRPHLVQQLLQECTSIKVKRLFLYLAEKAGHQWLSFVDRSAVDLGKGERSLGKGGVHVAKYNLVVPAAVAGL